MQQESNQIQDLRQMQMHQQHQHQQLPNISTITKTMTTAVTTITQALSTATSPSTATTTVVVAAIPTPTPTPTPTATVAPSTTAATLSSRHYVDKARLIKLVHENPILWDCRLPNYKRADKSKTDQWNSLGTIFNVSGERVQRTFTSLREIFRRELNNEKLLGRRFKSKWEFYKSMSFLRDVIRERKPRERPSAKLCRRSQLSPSINNPPSNSNGIDEYQYFAPNDPNNPSLQQSQQQQQNQSQKQMHTPIQQTITNDKSSTLIGLKTDMQQITLGNNSQISVLNLLTQLNNDSSKQQQQQQQQPGTHPQQNQLNQMNNVDHYIEGTSADNDNDNDNDNDDDDVNIIQPSPASSTTPSMYIKDEIEIPDEDDDDDDVVDEEEGEGEEDTTSITFNGEILYSNNNKVNIINSNMLNDTEGFNNNNNNNNNNNIRCKRRASKLNRNSTKSWKRILTNNGKHNNETLEVIDDDDDIDEDIESSVASIPNATTTTITATTTNVNNNLNKNKIILGNNIVDEAKMNHQQLINEQLSTINCIGGVTEIGGNNVAGGSTAGYISSNGGQIGGEAEIKFRRHLVYTKFADFIVAKMDAMCERDADDLMDRLMLVIAQKH